MAVADLVYPSIQTLMQIDQDLLPVLQPTDPIFDYFPIQETDDNVLRWEQLDNYRGLQQIRGLNGELPRVSRVGAKGYLMQPGVYGEKESIDEQEITRRRMLGSFTGRADITDLVRMCQEHLITREYARIRQVSWALATVGTFSVSNADGTVVQTDTFPLQTASAAVSWGTATTATPLVDFRTAKLLNRGHSVDFGARAKAYLNEVTTNKLLANTNANDLAGKRGPNGSTFNSLTNDNTIFLENGLPTLVAYDDGYLDDNGTFQPYIPDNVVVIFGVRPNNAPVGAYRKTFNANSDSPGSFMTLKDTKGEDVRNVTIGRGHNGGPIVLWPSAIIILSV